VAGAADTVNVLTIEFVFDRELGHADVVVLQRYLVEHAPVWSSGLHVRRSARDKRPINSRDPVSMAEVALSAATETGKHYDALVEKYGPPPAGRVTGLVEVRGSNLDLVVVIGTDSDALAVKRSGDRLLGNHIALQLVRQSVDRISLDEWSFSTLRDLSNELAPVWASAHVHDEYYAKVMSEPPEISAIGRDFNRFLPGLFWMNFFGRRYRDLIGHERLLSAPAPIVEDVGEGVLIGLGREPKDWETDARKATERAVLEHIGAEFFFDKSNPESQTTAPRWE
jgi:hypothetical protein